MLIMFPWPCGCDRKNRPSPSHVYAQCPCSLCKLAMRCVLLTRPCCTSLFPGSLRPPPPFTSPRPSLHLLSALLPFQNTIYPVTPATHPPHTQVVGSLLYFQRNLVVAASVTAGTQRTAFFARLNSWSAGIIAALQLTATSSMLRVSGGGIVGVWVWGRS